MPRARNGSTGQSTNSEVSVTVKVRMPHGSRARSYSTVRHPTGSFSASHSRGRKPPARRNGTGLGSSTRTPSIDRARARSSLPSCRDPSSPAASSGRPITVNVIPKPTSTTVTV